jgi:2-polyprenyl-3-methyl-5-hydroxy-6-metoxy-1,4-benzoquinol methylase
MTEAADAPSSPACLLCSSTEGEHWAVGWDAEYHTSDTRYDYYRCPRCDVLFIDPVPSDRLAEIYPPNYYSYVSAERSVVHTLKNRLDGLSFRRILRTLEGSELAALDVGGGDGAALDLLRQLDPRIRLTQVVDMDAGAEQLARRAGHEYSLGRIEDFRSARRFDVVLLLNLIEHVADPGAVLRGVRDQLSPGGVVVVKTPNFDSLDARVFRNSNWAGYHCPRHWVLFQKSSFVALAERSGLELRDFSYTQGAAFWAASLLFWLAERGHVSITAERPVMSHPLFPPLAALFAGFDLVRSLFGARTSQMFLTLGRRDAGSD